MPNVKKIKPTIKEILNGTLDQKLSQEKKLIFGVTGLLFAVLSQMILAWLIAPEAPDENEKALLSILITPFQLVAIYSLMNIIQSFTDCYPHKKGSLWDIDKKNYISFFLRVRAFSHNSFIVSILIANCLAIYMDYITKHPNFKFWFIINIITITVVYIGQHWLYKFMKRLEDIIEIIKGMLKEERIKEYEDLINRNFYTYREGFYLLAFFVLLKTIEIIFSGGSWIGGGEDHYVFPITPLWAIFTIYTVYWGAETTICSIIYFYSRFSSVLEHLKSKELKLFLFDSDGCAGLGTIIKFIYSLLAKLLIVTSVATFGLLVAILFSVDTSGDWKYIVIMTVFSMDIFALAVFLRPLVQVRDIIKGKKTKEINLLLNRINQIESKRLDRNLESNEIEEINHILDLIKKINKVPDWGISTQNWISLFSKGVFTFVPLCFQIITSSEVSELTTKVINLVFEVIYKS